MRMKVPANTTGPVILDNGNRHDVNDNYVDVPDSAVAELEGKGFTRETRESNPTSPQPRAPQTQPNPRAPQPRDR